MCVCACVCVHVCVCVCVCVCSGIMDSSGMRLWYTSTPREYEAGILAVGHHVTEHQIIPPNSKNFTTTGVVLEDCTNQVSFTGETGHSAMMLN